MTKNRLRVAWITFFPVEWLPEAPPEIRALTKGHPASWQRVLLRELQKDPSVELHIFSIRKSFARDVTFSSANATFYCLKAPGSLRAPSLFWIDTFLLRPHLKRIRPHIVHAWGMEQAAGLVASRLGYPFVLTMQGMFAWLKEKVQLNRYQKFMAFLEGRVLPNAPIVTVEAQFATTFLRRKYPKINVQQLEHAPDPVFSHTPRQCTDKKLRFVSLGAMNELKGGDLLIRSLAALSNDTHFELVSIANAQSPLLDKLRAELPSALFSKIQFKEGLTPSEVAQELAHSTMMIYPTRGDTSPNSVKEAVVHGLPVIATNVGGIPDYLVDGENGVIVSPDDVDSLSAGIERALKDKRFSVGAVDLTRLTAVRDYLSPEAMARGFMSIYRSVGGRI